MTTTDAPERTMTSASAPHPEERDTVSTQHSPAAALAARLGELPFLETLADRIQPLVEAAMKRAGQDAVDLLHGRPLGHALHPALSDLPIGLWAGAVVCDVSGQGAAAGTLTAAGLTAATATAASGWADWSGSVGRVRRLALLHGLVNAGGIGLQAASLVARLRGRRRAAMVLGAGGFAVTAASAWVGGELVMGHAMGVDHNVWRNGPEDWTDVAGLGDLAVGDVTSVEVAGRPVLLYRGPDGVHAMEDTCSHAGGPLHEGEVAEGTITCPWHGSCFRLGDGGVVHGPATYPQPLLQTRTRDGRIEVRGRAEV